MSDTVAAASAVPTEPTATGSNPATAVTSVDVDRLLDTQRVTPGHLLITLLAFVALMIDSYDLAVTSQLLPAIAKDFGTTSAALTQAVAYQTLGQAVGAFVFSPLADRCGRKLMLFVCLLLYGLATVGSVFNTDLAQFSALRLVGGALAGALMPITVSLVADVSPLKWRATFIGASYAGLAAGPLAMTAFTAFLFEPLGWRAAYWIGGIAPLLLLPFVVFLMPESPRFLARRKGGGERIARSLRLIGVRVPRAAASYFTKAPSSPSVPIVELFQGGRGLLTVALWTVCLFGVAAYTLNGLVSTFFHDFAGVPLAKFAAMQSLSLTGAILAMFATGPIMDRLGPYRAIVANAVLGGIAWSALAFVDFGTTPFKVLVFLGGFCGGGAQQGLNVLSPLLYPPSMRSSAVGAKGGFAKLAGAAAPLLAGVILATHAGLPLAMFACASALFLVAALTPLLGLAAKRASGRLAEAA